MLFFLILIKFQLILCDYYTIFEHRNISTSNYKLNSLNVISEFLCIAKCNEIDSCFSVSFSTTKTLTSNCYLYNQSFGFSSMSYNKEFKSFVKFGKFKFYIKFFFFYFNFLQKVPIGELVATFNESCSNIQCKPNSGLYCDPVLKTCQCENTTP
jgi:hypothetical protein